VGRVDPLAWDDQCYVVPCEFTDCLCQMRQAASEAIKLKAYDGVDLSPPHERHELIEPDARYFGTTGGVDDFGRINPVSPSTILISTQNTRAGVLHFHETFDS
jgi:hypothetical protein